MASTPKRRRRSKGASAQNSDGNQIPPTAGMPQKDQDDMIKSCMAAILPTIEDTFKRCMADYHNRSSQTTGQTPATETQPEQPSQPKPSEPVSSESVSLESVSPNPPLFEEITTQGTNTFTQPTKEGDPHLATGLTLGVDVKIRAKIHASEFVKFSTLLPKDLDYEETEKFKSVDKDGQLIFVKSNDKGPLKTIHKRSYC
ncbi:uncharacterized protein LOC134269938 [Saccostrea cucullata]|uniref:uncharacterized protein LOC134269938 n=1 Tax=Saccostrea cuccullata TaxID=36930 RepID=UPI002ED11595